MRGGLRVDVPNASNDVLKILDHGESCNLHCLSANGYISWSSAISPLCLCCISSAFHSKPGRPDP